MAQCFKVTGEVAGRPVTITWDGRELSGDQEALDLANCLVDLGETFCAPDRTVAATTSGEMPGTILTVVRTLSKVTSIELKMAD